MQFLSGGQEGEEELFAVLGCLQVTLEEGEEEAPSSASSSMVTGCPHATQASGSTGSSLLFLVTTPFLPRRRRCLLGLLTLRRLLLLLLVFFLLLLWQLAVCGHLFSRSDGIGDDTKDSCTQEQRV